MSTISPSTAALTCIALLERRLADPLAGDPIHQQLIAGLDADDLRAVLWAACDSFVLHTRGLAGDPCQVYRQLDEQRGRVLAWAARHGDSP